MRNGLTIFIIFLIMGAALGMALPVAHAQDETPVIVLHVLPNETNGSKNLATIPADSEKKIIVAGSNTTTETLAALANLCGIETPAGTPTPTASPTPTGTVTPAPLCGAIDIYFQIQWTMAWDSGLEDNCGIWGVCDRNVAPVINVSYGGQGNVISESWGNCGPAAHATGSCTNSLSGKIAAADIANVITGEGDYWNERFDVTYSDYWGGTTFQTDYSIILSTVPILPDCAGQYNIGAVLGSFNLAATNSIGVNLQTTLGMNYPAPGQWYVIQVSGAWQNNGAGPDLRSVGHKTGAGGVWQPFIASADVGCVDSGNDTYYLQMVSRAAVYLRVYDTDGNFASNMGNLAITISGVTAYDPYPSGCELQYQVGNLIEQQNVAANNYIGQPLKSTLPPSPGGNSYTRQSERYYMLETIGGPATLPSVLGSEVFTWDADLGQRDNATDPTPSNWYDASTAPFVVCSRQIDVVGHIRVFFPAERQSQILGAISRYFYSFRVRDTTVDSYNSNSGALGYRLFEATDMQKTTPGDIPGPDGCAKFSHVATPLSSVVIQATAVHGSSLPALVSNSLYAMEVSGGPWQDAGTSDSYSVELSDDGGASWNDLTSYLNLLCAASSDGQHVVIYVYGAAGKSWKVRVNDQDSNFGTNTGTINMDVYTGATTINEYPECASGYNLTEVPLSDEVRKVPGNDAAGKAIPATSLLGGSLLYSIQITDESKWYEAGAGDGSYLVDISDDGGTTWTPLEDYTVLCKEQIGDGDRFQIYFASLSNNYKLRVRDADNNFLTNTGFVMFKLYKAQANNYEPGPGSPTLPPPEWVVACNESYQRPSGYFTRYPFDLGIVTGSIPIPMVGEWIDYLRSAIIYYFAWCPQHTAKLQAVGELAMDKEPMASIQMMVNFIKSIQSLLQTYQASGGAGDQSITSQEPGLFSDISTIGSGVGGGSGQDPPASHGAGIWDMFVIGNFDPSTNVWFGGKVDLTTAMNHPYSSESDAYVTACSTKFHSLSGVFSGIFCGFMGMMRYSDIINWVLLILDLVISVWFIVKYIPEYCKRTLRLWAGGVRGVARVIGK